MRRQRLYRALAIVLKRMDLGEADRIVTLFTREHGKLRAVAKGVRRTVSKSAGHLEPFTVTEVMLAKGRELDVVCQAELVTALRHVREDLVLTGYAYYVTELTNLFTEDREENELLFDALTQALESLEAGVDPRLASLRFLVTALEAVGYRPELQQCVVCRAEIAPGGNYFSSQAGGVECPSCGERDGSARPIGDAPLKLIRNLQRDSSRIVSGVPDEVLRDAELALRAYAEQRVERTLETPRLIARVQQAVAGGSL